ncbi:MAG: stage II sporulation protein R [Oscillospiraceae bacterium]
MFRLKRWELAAMLALLCTLTLSAFYLHTSLAAQEDIAEKTVRLHVLANSDSEEDQARKLLVKDAVFARTEELLRESEDRPAAEAALEAALPELQDIAEETLRAAGAEETVQVTLETDRFPTRYYDSFTLPAGEYRTLRVVIGEGEGQNWWCVVFPPLCSAGQERLEEAGRSAGLTEDELALIQGGESEYLLRFRSVELWNKLVQWLTKDGRGA